MIRKMKNEKGFTLIELIMVIVLLGIMAAVAIPTFIDLSQDAEDARRDGAYASYLGSITMLHAQYLLQGTTYTESDVITNTVVSGGTDSQVAGTLTVTWDDGVVNTYGYTSQTGFTAAVLTNP